MIRMLWVGLLVATTALSTGCKKNKTEGDQGAVPSNGDTAGDKDSDDGEGSDDGEQLAVRPPTAADLETYTADLEGDGPLMATFETTQGTIHCELFEKGAPITVANFVGLARGLHPSNNPETGQTGLHRYYDGTVFHRVMPGFMIQGGDPTATGSGGPGYKFETEVSNELKHTPGTLSMANSGPDSNGAQFFITETAQKALDGGYNVFGRCKELDVVKKLAAVEKTLQPGGGRPEKSRPVNLDEVVLEKVTISRGMPADSGDGSEEAGEDDKGASIERRTVPAAQPPVEMADHHGAE